MKKPLLVALSLCLTVALITPAIAQAQEEEGPGSRYLTVTSFKVPFNERPKVMPFIINGIMPSLQLNPNVLNARLLFHNWGSDASDVVIVAEYENIEDIHADCGQPCEDYFEANPAPEEGDDGYAEFQEAQEAFNKYYSRHRDEIYVAPMEEAVVEGNFMGTVGVEEEEEE